MQHMLIFHEFEIISISHFGPFCAICRWSLSVKFFSSHFIFTLTLIRESFLNKLSALFSHYKRNTHVVYNARIMLIDKYGRNRNTKTVKKKEYLRVTHILVSLLKSCLRQVFVKVVTVKHTPKQKKL